MPDEEDVEPGESEAEQAAKADKAAKDKEKRLQEFRKKWVPRAEHEKVKADLVNLKHEKELENDVDNAPVDDAGDGKKPAGKKPADSPAEEKGKAKGKRGFVFPFPHEEDV